MRLLCHVPHALALSFARSSAPGLTLAQHDERGVVSMANTGANKNKSQFFITYAKHPHLDGRYTVFGRVIWGHEVLRAMENVPVSDKHVPAREIKIESVTIHANPIAEAAAS
jgi:peptidyl-prolyl cis-trans isomerase-like 3